MLKKYSLMQYFQNYDEILESLKKNVKVYLLKNTAILKRLRIENNVKKSDENDAVTLSRIPRDSFRLLSIGELEFKTIMRPLIIKYEVLTRWEQIIKHWLNDCDIPEIVEALKENVKLLERILREVSSKIIEKVEDYGLYREGCRLLGFRDSVEVAILSLELPLHLPLKTLKKVVGLTPDKNNGRYNRRFRKHLSQLAINIYINLKKHRLNTLEEFKIIVENLPRRKAVYKLQSRILKIFRRAYCKAIEVSNKPASR